MENKFKVRISRMFHSCKSRDDVVARHNVVEKSPFLSRTSMSAAPQMKPLPRRSICKLRNPPSLHINNTCIISSKEAHSFVPLSRNNRTSTRKSKLKPKSKSPVSPVEHFTCDPSFYYRCGTSYYAVGNDCRKKRKKKKKRRNKPQALPSFDDHDFLCGDDEREDGDDEDEDDERTTDTLFYSRRPSSSESSNRYRRRTKSVTRTMELGEAGTGVRGSFAVVKKTRDPYGDFRKSMMEIIIERQIFGEDELEQLLLCFLSLNSSHHHKIIARVFNEIWDALHEGNLYFKINSIS